MNTIQSLSGKETLRGDVGVKSTDVSQCVDSIWQIFRKHWLVEIIVLKEPAQLQKNARLYTGVPCLPHTHIHMYTCMDTHIVEKLLDNKHKFSKSSCYQVWSKSGVFQTVSFVVPSDRFRKSLNDKLQYICLILIFEEPLMC